MNIAENQFSPAAGERIRNDAAFDTIRLANGGTLAARLTKTLGSLFRWGQGEAQNGWPNKPNYAVSGNITGQKLEGGRRRIIKGFSVQVLPADAANGNPAFLADAQAILGRAKLYMQQQGGETDCLGLLADHPAGVGLANVASVVASVSTPIVFGSNGVASRESLRELVQPIELNATQIEMWVESQDSYTLATDVLIRVRALGYEISPTR